MRYLGVDYGSKRVGLALSDETGSMGFPHSILPNTKHLVEDVCALIEREKVDAIVIGESKNLSGEENPIAEDAKDFGDAIARISEKPVFFESEIFTSAEARRAPRKINPARQNSMLLWMIQPRHSFLPVIFHGQTMDKPKITIEEFGKIEVKIGTVRTAEKIPETEKLFATHC